MLIICPKCSAKYCLPDDITLKNDQKLKCSACRFLFTAAESASLDLTQQMRVAEDEVETPAMRNNPPPMWVAPIERAEMTDGKSDVQDETADRVLAGRPADILNAGIGAEEALPEAFVPVAADEKTEPKKNCLWIVLIYVLAISGFCWAAWSYRDILMPSFYGFAPAKTEVVKSAVQSDASVKTVGAQSTGGAASSIQSAKQSERQGGALTAKTKPTEKASGHRVPTKKNEVANAVPPVADMKETKTAEDSRVEGRIRVVGLTPAHQIESKETVIDTTKKAVLPAVKTDVTTEKSAALSTNEKKTADQAVSEPKKNDPSNDVVVGANAGNTTVVKQRATDSDVDEIWKTDSGSDAGKQVADIVSVAEQPLLDIVAEPIPAALENELVIENVRFHIAPNEQGVSQMLIEGSVLNRAAALRSVPVLTATVWDENSQILERKKVHVAQEHLNPSESVSFYTSLVPAPVGAHHVDVTF